VLRRLNTAFRIGSRLTTDEQLQLKNWVLDVLLKKLTGKFGESETREIERIFETKGAEDVTYAIERAIDEAVRRSKREGKNEGKAEGKIEAAKIALRKGFSVKDVAEITGIDEETVRKLQADTAVRDM
jgi:predicted transposase/invertase (TIGR01784 family)